jgi:hypothetical protein
MDDAGDSGTSIRDDAVLVQSERALQRRTMEAVVVLGDRVPIVLRGTGAAIWDAFATGRSVSEVTDDLADAYGTTPDVVARDLRPVVRRLLDEHALTVIAGTDAGGRSS